MELPNYLYIDNSSVHGKGLFTKKSFTKREFVFRGQRQIQKIENSDVPIAYINEHPIIPKIHCPQIASNTYHVYSFDSFMNHSNKPNTTIQYHDDLSYSHIATRDIDKNEELTVSYKEVYLPEYPANV
jgi:hypothetical protein